MPTKKNVAIKLRKFNRVCPITGFNEESIKIGSLVVVQTDRGIEAGEIATYPHGFPRSRSKDVKLKKVLRYATSEDIKKYKDLPALEQQAIDRVNQKIKEHELPIKIINLEYLLDGSLVEIYYRVTKGAKAPNLRDFGRDLSAEIKAKVNLHEISARSEARMIGGLGPCGKLLCCSTWLEKPKHVTVKMLKEQGIPISPTKTAGMCGRLMCCFAYEEDKK